MRAGVISPRKAAAMSERLKDLIAYIVAVSVLVAGSYMSAMSARLHADGELVTKLRPPAATADAAGTETIPPFQGR